MDIKISLNLQENSEQILRRCGYAKQYDRNTNLISYFRRLTTQHFPKFHVYVNNERPLELSIHLDQKPHTYSGQRSHGGEYDGPLVEKEVVRIKAVIGGIANAPKIQKLKEESEGPKGFFGRLFG